ncbi:MULTISPECIES: MoxR family ATPase [unclassified Ruminococcus]|uniref:AAA family ATPase n=1 Tax=unclassified Ruminococcus TaxID=2608920 RepID=UPI00210DD612|nr:MULTISPECIES: MoxR family ATPase [unclassified Ruminococcus]MCQ4021811.1 AAA domain-containing protein [Ruminococcus sp. zg-924]MCQ4114256.1 AAA domain-containing protein [Ruminococcus sp. zg-921]
MNELQAVITEVKKVINGKDNAIITSLLAILTNGNILFEDIPGVGKTTLALAFSKALGLSYGRVQFTPDTLPSDITGFVIYDKETGKMRYKKGAVFCNLFLADELNRTSSRTQAALLEAMEEGQVTVEGRAYPLEKPFTVIATQNPVGASGTQLLPDSQIDRFTVRISMGYPDSNSELKMLLSRKNGNPLDSVSCIVTKERLLEMQQQVKAVFMHESIARYIVGLITKTRNSRFIRRGASPRVTLSLAQMSKANAFLCGRDFVTPKDVQSVFESTVNHRIMLSAEALSQKLDTISVLADVCSSVKPPRI